MAPTHLVLNEIQQNDKRVVGINGTGNLYTGAGKQLLSGRKAYEYALLWKVDEV